MLTRMTAHYPSGWAVELATLDDFTTIQAILTDRCRWLGQKGIRQWPAAGFPPDVIEKAIDEETMYTARVGKEIVGTFTLRDTDKLWRGYLGAALHVRRMATHTSWGGRGIGGAMLSWTVQRAIDDARSFVRLSCVLNDGALAAYYESEGFSRVAQITEDNTEVVLMERAAE